MIRKILDSTLTAIAITISLVVGVLIAAATFVWHFIPKRDRERKAAEQQEADRRAAEIKEILKREHEKRAADAAKSIAAVGKKAEEQKSQDSVAMANKLLEE
jgi:hypothetical protein